MNRRGFLKFLAAGAAAGLAVRTFPFRVYSFPSEIKRYNLADLGAIEWSEAGQCWYLEDQVQALELEMVRREIPDLIKRGDKLLQMFRDSKEIGMGSASSFLPAPIGEPVLRVPMRLTNGST